MYVEVLASMLLLTAVLLAIGPLFIQALKLSAASGDATFAAMAAQNKVEDLLTVASSALTDGQDTLTSGSMSFGRSWVVQNDAPQPGMKTVTITVTSSRIAVFGRSHTVTLRIYHGP